MAALKAGRPYVLIVLVSGLLFSLAGCSSNTPAPEPNAVVNLLQQNWQHTPGVTAKSGYLQVVATAQGIVEQDGGGGQPNPPLNLAGTHLVIDGDFSLSASFTEMKADVSWAVYDSPPVIADEFRIEPAGLRLTLRGDDLEIAVFDGLPQQEVTDPQPAHNEHVRVSDPKAALSVLRTGDRLKITSGADTSRGSLMARCTSRGVIS